MILIFVLDREPHARLHRSIARAGWEVIFPDRRKRNGEATLVWDEDGYN